MTIQASTTVRDAQANAIETAVGASPKLRWYNGTMPANCAAALSGNTLLAEGTLPSDFLTAASGNGQVAKNGTWTLTGQSGAGAGTNATFWRLYENAGTTCHYQGTLGVNVVIATNNTTAANANVLNFASTTGVVVGMNISGTGVVTGATVIAVTGTTVTMSHASTAGVGNAASITFKYDMEVDNVNVANGQGITVSAWSNTRGNA